MTKDELDRTLEKLRQVYKTSDPKLQKQIKLLADHAKWLYERDNDTTGMMDQLL